MNNVNAKLNYCKIIRNKETKIRKILNKIYKPDPTFRFTSRYINSILVAFVSLYYFVVFFAYGNLDFFIFMFLLIIIIKI